MRVQLAPQAQESRGQSDVVRITERVDDVALRIGQMVTRGVPEVLERPLPRPGTPRGRRWGWTAGSGLASIVTEGAHRHVAGEASLQGLHHTLSDRTAEVIAPLDFRADRLRHLLTHVRTPASWHQSERAVQAHSMAGHAWPQDVIRGAAPTVSGEHEVTDGGLGQCGQRQDEPTRP